MQTKKIEAGCPVVFGKHTGIVLAIHGRLMDWATVQWSDGSIVERPVDALRRRPGF